MDTDGDEHIHGALVVNLDRCFFCLRFYFVTS